MATTWKQVSFSDHTHSYAPLSGATFTGAITGTTATFSNSANDIAGAKLTLNNPHTGDADYGSSIDFNAGTGGSGDTDTVIGRITSYKANNNDGSLFRIQTQPSEFGGLQTVLSFSADKSATFGGYVYINSGNNLCLRKDTTDNDLWQLDNDGGTFRIFQSGLEAFTMADGTGNATFAGGITMNPGGHFIGNNSNTSDLMIESGGDDIDIVGSWLRMRVTAAGGVQSAWRSTGELTLGADAQTTYMLKVASGNSYFAGNIDVTDKIYIAGINSFDVSTTSLYIGSTTGANKNTTLQLRTNDTPAIDINSSQDATFAGYVTSPTNPKFHVRQSTSSASSFTFGDTEIIDIGNNFASSKFTAPVDGTYHFTFRINMTGDSILYFWKNGVAYTGGEHRHDRSGSWEQGTISEIMTLATDDYIEAKVVRYSGYSANGGYWDGFFGYLIG